MIFLRRLINSLNNRSNSFCIYRIFCIITIHYSNSLVQIFQPVLNNILSFTKIHELCIVDVSVLLSLHFDQWRYTFRAHSFWIRLMIRTIFLNFVVKFQIHQTVVAFLVGSMHFALGEIFINVLIKGQVLDVLIFLRNTVQTFGMRTMITLSSMFLCNIFLFSIFV